jgi:hypothetical protein
MISRPAATTSSAAPISTPAIRLDQSATSALIADESITTSTAPPERRESSASAPIGTTLKTWSRSRLAHDASRRAASESAAAALTRP